MEEAVGSFLHLFFLFHINSAHHRNTLASVLIFWGKHVFSAVWPSFGFWFGFSTVAMERKTVRGANWSYSNFIKLSDKTGSF